ncbi:MAG: hypothetical protein AB3X44_18100 [Leptothrix sp. (in: b-proteobacteria)]
MSETLRVALIAEGPTDATLIEAALKGFLDRPFVLIQLQPEPTRPQMGAGWGGVLKWCRAFAAGGHAALENDPTLEGFDLFILHLDADVANKSYADYGDELVHLAAAQGLPAMPCARPCPPASASVEQVERLLGGWLNLPAGSPGPQTVWCIPSKSTESWLVAAWLNTETALLAGVECNARLESRLASLPKGRKLRKTVTDYRKAAPELTRRWHSNVRPHCAQAHLFEQRVTAALPPATHAPTAT